MAFQRAIAAAAALLIAGVGPLSSQTPRAVKGSPKPASKAPAKPATPPAPLPPRLVVEPRTPATGTLCRVVIDRLVRNGDSVTAAVGELAGEPLHFVASSNAKQMALCAVPLDASDSVVARVVVSHASGAIDTLHETIRYPHHAPEPPAKPSRTRTPGVRRLRVDTRFTQPMDSATEARVERENEEARAIGRATHETPKLWTYPFLRPRPSRVTSKYGSGRLFNGRVTSSHLGIDYKGAEGEPIFAANRGVVAFVGEFFLAGNVVYVDHGAGLMTGYFHMSRPEVSVGDTVERGQEIGKVGATGRVTGPHLHWSARYGAQTIDPGDLLALSAPFVLPDTAVKKRAPIKIRKDVPPAKKP